MSIKKVVGYRAGSGTGSISQRYGFGSAPKCRGSPTLVGHQKHFSSDPDSDPASRTALDLGWKEHTRKCTFKSNKQKNFFKQISFLLASWRSMTKIARSGSESRSISQRHGSADLVPDPHQNVMDPEHWDRHKPSCPAAWASSPPRRVVSRPPGPCAGAWSQARPCQETERKNERFFKSQKKKNLWKLMQRVI